MALTRRHANSAAPPRRGFEPRMESDHGRPELYGSKPGSFAFASLQEVEPDAVVGYRQPDFRVVILIEADGHTRRAPMPYRVADRFLGDAVKVCGDILIFNRDALSMVENAFHFA